MSYKAQEIANRLLSISKENESDVSNLKLQKLLYYAQGFNLALFNKSLFKEEIKAWAHGPVVPKIYHEFKQFGSNPIDPPDTTEPLDSDTESLLAEVYEVFGQFSAWKLRDMTHEEAPWIEHESNASVIPKEELKKYFKTRVA